MTDPKIRDAPRVLTRPEKQLGICVIVPLAIVGGLGFHYLLFRQMDWSAAAAIAFVMALGLLVVFMTGRTSPRARHFGNLAAGALGIAFSLFLTYRHFGHIPLLAWLGLALTLAIVLALCAVFEIVRRRQLRRRDGEPIAPDGRLNQMTVRPPHAL